MNYSQRLFITSGLQEAIGKAQHAMMTAIDGGDFDCARRLLDAIEDMHLEATRPDLQPVRALDEHEKQLALSGQKIEAIKALRARISLSLKDAKETVEDFLEAQGGGRS